MGSEKFGTSRGIRSFEMNMEESHYQGMSKAELEGHSKVICDDDVVDRLPVDPFGMDMKSTVTTIKGWPQDFDGFGSNFGKYGFDEGQKNYLNVASISIQDHSFNGFGVDGGLNHGCLDSKSNVGTWVVFDKKKELQGEGGDPHDALFFALGYLGVKDLLAVERVCRSLHDAVRGDSLLWRSIHIDKPLNEKITDGALAKLTGRAQGTLECVNLVDCIRITDNGLKQVLESNPRLTKLSVPGCMRLTVNGILLNLRALKSVGTLRMKQIRIGGLMGVTEQQFKELKSLLVVDNHMQLRANKPLFHRPEQLYLSCDDDRAIDIETCPRCRKLRLIYDCPAESCQGNGQANQLCRACTLCIVRCFHCGCCIKDRDYEETFCLDFLCLDCLKQLRSCQDKPEVGGASCSGHTIFHQGMR